MTTKTISLSNHEEDDTLGVNYSVPREPEEENNLGEEAKELAKQAARFGVRVSKLGVHYGVKMSKVMGKYGWKATKFAGKNGWKATKVGAKLTKIGAAKAGAFSKNVVAPKIVNGAKEGARLTQTHALPFVKTYFKELIVSTAVAATTYMATEAYLHMKHNAIQPVSKVEQKKN